MIQKLTKGFTPLERRPLTPLKKKVSRSLTGFTLIETLVAVLLLTTALAGPLTIASRGLLASITARDQIIAFYLGQDAVEYVRFIRDTNRLGGISWLAGLDGTSNGHTNSAGVGGQCTSADGTQSCLIDSVQDTVASCGAVLCTTAIRYFADTDPQNNSFFSNTAGNTTTFTRTIAITTPVNSNADEASLTVTVSWVGENQIARSIVVRENIFNWQ
jgi:Tfp pilus assembly protein PilV